MELKKYLKIRTLPEGWSKWKVSDKAKTASGATPLTSNALFYENGDIPWINSGELSESEIVTAQNFISKAGFENSATKMFPVNTVLIAMYGATVGKTSLLKLKACTNQAICAIIPNKSYYSPFLKYYFESLSTYLISLSSGSARDNISQETIKNHIVFSPTLVYEQKRLVSIIETIDRKIALNREINRNLPLSA